tara:strand:- start:704 stop:1720 length:1017 start_codon:yes stop_codon:yes gene_type:complete
MGTSFAIKHSPHKLWQLYKTNPPVQYRNSVLASHFLHSFNSIRNYPFVKNIVEFEHILHLTGESRDYKRMVSSADELFKKLSSNKVAALISPTEKAISICSNYFSEFETIKHKFHSVPTAVIPKKLSVRDSGSCLNLLFIGNKFWGKGGNVAIQVAKTLSDNGVEVKLRMVCNDIPVNYPIPECVDVIRTAKLSQSDKDELYGGADIFLFPVLHDSFGVHIECLEYSLPMVTTNIYDKAEIIEHGISGFLTKPPFELYGPGFATEWPNWNSFCDYIRASDYEGRFLKMIDEMANNISLFYDDNMRLDQFKQTMLKNTMSEFSLDDRNASIRSIYDSVS